MPHRVVIIGGGFGGLLAAKNLGRSPVDLTLLDRHNYHLFQPLLYQVATGGLSPGDIAAPLRAVLRRNENTEVLLGEAVDFDVENRRVKLTDGEIEYDTLVLATGSAPSYFGHNDWEEWAPPLKSIEDATEIRRRMLVAFEAAEREPDAERRRAWLTFVIVGAGPTGVELAGAFAEIARDTLKGHFRVIDPGEARIFLVEHAPMVLPVFERDLSAHAERDLVRLGVLPKLGTAVTGVDRDGVTITSGNKTEHIAARTVIWAAGVRTSGLSAKLAERAGVALDRGRRVMVQPDLSVPGHPEIFVIGDLAHLEQDGKMLPGLAPVAMQEGRYVARVIDCRARGRSAPPPFRYWDKGTLATIGRAKAAGLIWSLHVTGWFAWVSWLFIHLAYLIGFENRLLVLIQWAFNYFTFNRRARLITGPSPLPFVHEPESVNRGQAT